MPCINIPLLMTIIFGNRKVILILCFFTTILYSFSLFYPLFFLSLFEKPYSSCSIEPQQRSHQVKIDIKPGNYRPTWQKIVNCEKNRYIDDFVNFLMIFPLIGRRFHINHLPYPNSSEISAQFFDIFVHEHK